MSKPLRRGWITVTCAALAIAGGSAVALAASGRSYLGHTSQGKRVGLAVKGNRVTTFAILFEAKCPRGGAKAGAGAFGWTGTPPPLVLLSRQGRFSNRVTLHGITENKKSRYKLSVDVTGHVTASRAAGTFSGLFRFYTLKGTFTEQCPTGTLTWSAL